MNTQLKAVVASAVVIALCLAAVGGVTYSWFSDTESSDISIDTARIDIESEFTYAEKVSGPGQFSVTPSTTSPDTSLIVSNLAANCQVNLTLTTTYGTSNNVNTICKTTAKIEPTSTGGTTGLTQNDLENIYIGGLSLADQGLTVSNISTPFVVFPSTILYNGQGVSLAQNTCIYTPAEYSYSGTDDNKAAKSFKIVFTTTAYQDDYTDTSTMTIDENNDRIGKAEISTDSRIISANTLGSFENVKVACSAYTGTPIDVTVTDTSTDSVMKMKIVSDYTGKVTVSLTFTAGTGIKATDYSVTNSSGDQMTILAAMNALDGSENKVTLTFTAESPSEFTISGGDSA